MATMKDIAQRSGAGIATVSRVINNSGYVAADTRQRVEQAIKDLGYRPNPGARLLRGGRSHLVGVLVPSIKVDFFARLAHRLEQALFSKGYQTLICSTGEDSNHESDYVAMLLAQRVDGVMVAAVRDGGDTFGTLQGAGIPVLALDRRLRDAKVPLVGGDHFVGGRIAAEHLIGLGHRRISVVGAPQQSAPIQMRVAGATEACQTAGLPPPRTILGPEHNVQACSALVEQALSVPDRPTGIVATSDIAALGALHAARRLGISLPQDLSVTGFDDTPMASYVFPALTTVAQPIDAIAGDAIATLLRMIEQPDAAMPDDIVRPVTLMARQSTAVAP